MDISEDVTKTYHVGKQYAGLIIGQKGATIRGLQNMPGVFQVNLDCKGSYDLIVTASSADVCDMVHDEVERQIFRCKRKASWTPVVTKSFIESDVDQKVVLTTNSSNVKMYYIDQKSYEGLQNYQFQKFEDLTFTESMRKLSIKTIYEPINYVF